MMLRVLLVLLALLPQMAGAADSPTRPTTVPAATRFVMADVHIDSGDKPLAAWQVEVKATQGNVKIVGVEGGEHKDLYRDPPYYDPAALAGGRIIVASLTTSNSAPKGKSLVARLHLQVEGQYELTAAMMAAADANGKSIQATPTLSKAIAFDEPRS